MWSNIEVVVMLDPTVSKLYPLKNYNIYNNSKKRKMDNFMKVMNVK